jgi:hypothetical protein
MCGFESRSRHQGPGHSRQRHVEQPRGYEKEKPVPDLSRDLEGPLEAWGMFPDRKGEAVKRFHVKMIGTWNNNVGRLGKVTLGFRKLRSEK